MIKHPPTGSFCKKVLFKQRPPTAYESGGQEFESLRARHVSVKHWFSLKEEVSWTFAPAALVSSGGIKHEHGAWHVRKKVPKALEAATTRRAARLLVETNAGYQGSKC
jgi:hypothetical protein